MATRIHGLSKKTEIEQVFVSGRTTNSKHLTVKAKKNKTETYRACVMIGIKISKLAVVRNKIRRRLRAIINQLLSDKLAGYDLILIGRPQINQCNYKELKQELASCFNRLSLF